MICTDTKRTSTMLCTDWSENTNLAFSSDHTNTATLEAFTTVFFSGEMGIPLHFCIFVDNYSKKKRKSNRPEQDLNDAL